MATQDWPTDTAFAGAEFRPGVDVPKSTFRGFYTGNRGSTSHLADRLTCEVMLPPCVSRTDAARREAFFMGLLSTGDWVRFGMAHRRQPLGTMGGDPTVNGPVAAGARSLALSTVLARPNILTGGGFEIDSNADGLADSWTTYTSGSVGTVTTVMPSAAANTGTAGLCQRISSTALNGAIGVRRTADVPVTAGLPYTWSITQTATSGTTISLEIAWYAGASYISSSMASAVASNGRRSVTGTAPLTATVVKLYVYMTSASAAAAAINIDEAQFEQASAATAYAGLATAGPGDFFGIGGNLLQVAYAGATATDAGAMTVPLVCPAPKAISNGAAVTLLQPTGTWELDTDGLQLDYTAGIIQGGIAVPFRQVPV